MQCYITWHITRSASVTVNENILILYFINSHVLQSYVCLYSIEVQLSCRPPDVANKFSSLSIKPCIFKPHINNTKENLPLRLRTLWRCFVITDTTTRNTFFRIIKTKYFYNIFSRLSYDKQPYRYLANGNNL